MKQDNCCKIKLIKILEILHEFSDENNPMDTYDILSKLEQLEIKCDRRTLASDIELLNQYGYEIMISKEIGKSTHYYIDDRKFDIPELKILIDAIQSASFITPKKTKILIDKIASLNGKHQSEILKNNLVEYNASKRYNEQIYYNINEIEKALQLHKKISFVYFDYDKDLKQVLRHQGKRYYVNPVTTICAMNNYYLICYDDYHDKINHYRIDKMKEVELTRHDIIVTNAIKEFDLKKHCSQVFGMYVGEKEKIILDIDSSLIETIIDKFGTDIKLQELHNKKLRLSAYAQISVPFINWCMGFGNKLKVIAPNHLVRDIKNHIKEINDLYQ